MVKLLEYISRNPNSSNLSEDVHLESEDVLEDFNKINIHLNSIETLASAIDCLMDDTGAIYAWSPSFNVRREKYFASCHSFDRQ